MSAEPKRITEDLIARALSGQGDGGIGDFNPLDPDQTEAKRVEASMRYWKADAEPSFEDMKGKTAQIEAQVYPIYPSMVKKGHHVFPQSPKDSGADWVHRTLINLAHIHFGTAILKNIFRYNHFFAIPDDVFDFAPGDATEQDRGFYVRLSQPDSGPVLALHVGPVIQDIEQAEQTLLDAMCGLWQMLKTHNGKRMAELQNFEKEDLMVLLINAQSEAWTLSEINRSLNAVLQGRKEDAEAFKIPEDIKAEIEAGREPLPKDDLIKRVGNDDYQPGQDLIPDKVKDPFFDKEQDPRSRDAILMENEELRELLRANIMARSEADNKVEALKKEIDSLKDENEGLDKLRMMALKDAAVLRTDLDGLRETATAQQNGLSEANRLLASKTEQLAKLEKESMAMLEKFMEAKGKIEELEKQAEENQSYRSAFNNLVYSLGDKFTLFVAESIENRYQTDGTTGAFNRLKKSLEK